MSEPTKQPFTLYIANLHPVTTKTDLDDFIEAEGFSCEYIYLIKYDHRTREKLDRSSAMVVLTEPERAQEAIEKLNGRTFLTREMVVRRYNYKSKKAEAARCAPAPLTPNFMQTEVTR
jgi:RNA recognition motif-containing protein